jgi:DNA-binding beta-propeller fold protein YncE
MDIARLRTAALCTAIIGVVASVLLAVAAQESAPPVPHFEWDPTFPKMPSGQMLGAVVGVAVDAKDHIWIVHRSAGTGTGTLTNFQRAAEFNPPHAECCIPAPPVIEFDQTGRVVSSWGGPGPGYEWPSGEHGIFIDHQDNVWIGSNGQGRTNGPPGGVAGLASSNFKEQTDTQILKFTRTGKFLLQVGKQNVHGGNADTQNMLQPTGIFVDAANNEVYVSDGEHGNHRRVIVFDGATGVFKRMWGAYGNQPEDADPGEYKPDESPSKQFRYPHGIELSKDGLVYVADRSNDRVQVFKKDGTFMKEQFIAPKTLYPGSVDDIAFSADPQERYMYVADSMNKRVWILDRQSLMILGRFGEGGNHGGQFNQPHSIAVDHKGNIYVTETLEGKRIQRFLLRK